VQVGPRILEDPNRVAQNPELVGGDRVEMYRRPTGCNPNPQPVYLGIRATPSNLSTYLRAALAVDEPCRNAKANEKATDREFARNAYLVVTTTPAGFWDLQDMLKSQEFYANEKYAPSWALNLPGDDYAAMVYDNKGERGEVGEVGLRQASVLVF